MCRTLQMQKKNINHEGTNISDNIDGNKDYVQKHSTLNCVDLSRAKMQRLFCAPNALVSNVDTMLLALVDP